MSDGAEMCPCRLPVAVSVSVQVEWESVRRLGLCDTTAYLFIHEHHHLLLHEAAAASAVFISKTYSGWLGSRHQVTNCQQQASDGFHGIPPNDLLKEKSQLGFVWEFTFQLFRLPNWSLSHVLGPEDRRFRLPNWSLSQVLGPEQRQFRLPNWSLSHVLSPEQRRFRLPNRSLSHVLSPEQRWFRLPNRSLSHVLSPEQRRFRLPNRSLSHVLSPEQRRFRLQNQSLSHVLGPEHRQLKHRRRGAYIQWSVVLFLLLLFQHFEESSHNAHFLHAVGYRLARFCGWW